jgi:hypothetical protein
MDDASMQVLAELPVLESVDLSFNIYMEAAASLAPLLEHGGLARLRRLDLRQGQLRALAAGSLACGQSLLAVAMTVACCAKLRRLLCGHSCKSFGEHVPASSPPQEDAGGVEAEQQTVA